jgi:hypothetical protein
MVRKPPPVSQAPDAPPNPSPSFHFSTPPSQTADTAPNSEADIDFYNAPSQLGQTSRPDLPPLAFSL